MCVCICVFSVRNCSCVGLYFTPVRAVQWRQQAKAVCGRGLDGWLSLHPAGRSDDWRGPLGQAPDLERPVRHEGQRQDPDGHVAQVGWNDTIVP